MRYLLILALLASVSACGTTATVLYSTSDTIGVRYMDSGVVDDGSKAMGLIAQHCPSGFDVTNRTHHDRDVMVDAKCK